MPRTRFTGEPSQPAASAVPVPNKPETQNRNYSNKTWVRRTRHNDGMPAGPPEWHNKPEPPPELPKMYNMVPSPPMIGKQPIPLMPYYPINPAMYPNMALKDDKAEKDPKHKFTMGNFMGPLVPGPPGSFLPGPFVPAPNIIPGVKSAHDKSRQQFITGPYFKEPPVQNPMFNDPKFHQGYEYSGGFVNLSQVDSLGPRPKRNYETMSEISEQDSEHEDDEQDNAPTNLTNYEIKYYTPFLPKPPERYKMEYTLHETKVFLPLGVKAYVKNMSLNPKLSMGFETGPVRNGKLVLLLDLDNTLLHTASQGRLDMLDIDTGDFVDSLGDPELYSFTLPNFPNVNYYMKLRPCIREFLQILSLYYEMAIYTNATKEYADVVISILDPDRSLFMDRIVARNSIDEKDLLKSASRLYPELDTRFILAFDDRRDVWSDIPHKQVVRAEHYDFFESYYTDLNNNYSTASSETNVSTKEENLNKGNSKDTKKNVTTSVSRPETGNDYTFDVDQYEDEFENEENDQEELEEDNETENNKKEKDKEDENKTKKKNIVDHDRHLRYMVRVFLEIHKRFFDDPFRNDVGDIVENLQSQILKGVGVLLTGYRKNTKMTNTVLHTDCEQRQRENLAEMGASVVLRLNDSKLTHIMAGKNCTDNITKSRDPQYNNIHKVHTLWLYSCRATFTKVDESLFNVDDVCSIYSNEPPQLPNKDHWKILNKNKEIKEFSETNYKRKSKQELPTRIFMGTGAYSNGTEVLSSVEKIVIKWDPSKTNLLQNSLGESSKLSTRLSKLESLPFTNAVNPNKYAF